MTRTAKAAMAAAIIGSAVSIGDAVYRGVVGHDAAQDDQTAQSWTVVAVSLVLTAAFGLLAAVLVQNAERIDGSSRFVRWVRRLLLGDLALLSAIFAVATALAKTPDALAALAGIAFVLMFLLSLVLGGTLVWRRELRLPAVLMMAPLALVPLAGLVGEIAPDWAHPGYAETALYLGLALLGRNPDRHTVPATEHPTPATAQQ
jgi:hypothetical protein